MSQWKGKRVLIIGLGVSGRSAAVFLLARHAFVSAIDCNHSSIDGAQMITGLRYIPSESEISMDDFDCIVVSPGIPPSNYYYRKAIAAGIEVIGEVELACREMTQKCIGVTGTNGKTTVTLMITHILNNAGIKAQALGNIGIPLSSEQPKCDVCVIELSSFQLETLKHPFLDMAVLLNITPDHLDRYPSMKAYAETKTLIEKCLKPGGALFVEENCLAQYHSLFQGKPLSYGYLSKSSLFTDQSPSHDLENILAAYAICHGCNVCDELFLEGLATFKKPPHRIEFIRSHLGVDYYDDSKGTNIDAVIRAVEAKTPKKGKILLIAGGVDKGFPYTSWRKNFNGKVKSIFAIGQSSVKIKEDLDGAIPVSLCDTLEKAVISAAAAAVAGDIVLLSPGCSSFDMFNDYIHRGQEFQRVVHAL